MSKHLKLENYLGPVRLQGGVYTALPVTLTGTAADLSVGGDLSVTGATTFTGQFRSSTSTAVAASGGDALDPTDGQVFTLTPTASETLTASSAPVGAVMYLVVTTSGTSSYTLTFGTNFKSTGTLATGTVSAKVFVVTFVGDGTNMNEVSRTTAM